MTEFVTPNGKHIDIGMVEDTALRHIYFREGGELPPEFKGSWTNDDLATAQIKKYLARIEKDGEKKEETPPEPVQVEGSAFAEEVPEEVQEVMEDAKALPDVLTKEEGIVDGKVIPGYKYGTGEFKGMIVKKKAA